MPLLNDWIDQGFLEVANKLPHLIHTEPASFACGFNSGYKQALIDIENNMNKIVRKDSGFKKYYSSIVDDELF